MVPEKFQIPIIFLFRTNFVFEIMLLKCESEERKYYFYNHLITPYCSKVQKRADNLNNFLFKCLNSWISQQKKLFDKYHLLLQKFL